MRKTTSLLVLTILNAAFCVGPCAEQAQDESTQTPAIAITIVFDNYLSEPGLVTAWGFACVIEGLEETVLFDTGGNGGILLHNMQALGIDSKAIDTVVLSHFHGDHVDGLPAFLEKNNDVRVFVPVCFPSSFDESVRKTGAELIEVGEARAICADAGSTGEIMGYPREQGLIVETPEGPVLITGCAHPGIVRMAEVAREVAGRDLYLVMGGFHMVRSSEAQIRDAIEQLVALGVKRVAPSHCSGDFARTLFQEAFGENFIVAGVGTRITIDSS